MPAQSLVRGSGAHWQQVYQNQPTDGSAQHWNHEQPRSQSQHASQERLSQRPWAGEDGVVRASAEASEAAGPARETHHLKGQLVDAEPDKAKARAEISFLDVNADDELSFYSVNRDQHGNALINLAASQQRHNELMSPHLRKMKEVRRALNKRPPTANTYVRKKAYRCDPTILPFASAAEQGRSEEGHARLLDNFDRHHTQPCRNRQRAHSSQQLAPPAAETPDPLLPQEATLLFEKFTVAYPLRAINEKEYINPAYYDKENGLELRAAARGSKDAQAACGSGLLLSAFHNPKTQVVLKKSSNDNKPNMYTNTRSFAAKYGRMAPKHRVKRVVKDD